MERGKMGVDVIFNLCFQHATWAGALFAARYAVFSGETPLKNSVGRALH